MIEDFIDRAIQESAPEIISSAISIVCAMGTVALITLIRVTEKTAG